MITIRKFTFNPFAENTYILHDETLSAVVIDPGCYDTSEESELKDYIHSHKLKLIANLNTHCHIDHVLGNKFIFNEYGIRPIIHKEDLPILLSVVNYGKSFGVIAEESPEPDKYLKDGDVVSFGSSLLNVLHVPGHLPGHVVFVCEGQKFIIGGDVLFRQSIGRTDLPLGDHNTLIRSIRNKLLVMDEAYIIHPGHGPETTIGYEKKNNPFL